MQEGVGSGNSYKTLERTFLNKSFYRHTFFIMYIRSLFLYTLWILVLLVFYYCVFLYIFFAFVLLLYLTSSSCFSLLLFYFIRHQTLLCSLIKASIRYHRAWCRVFRHKPIYVMHNCTFLATHISIYVNMCILSINESDGKPFQWMHDRILIASIITS